MHKNSESHKWFKNVNDSNCCDLHSLFFSLSLATRCWLRIWVRLPSSRWIWSSFRSSQWLQKYQRQYCWWIYLWWYEKNEFYKIFTFCKNQKFLNRMCTHQTNIKRNGKMTDFDAACPGWLTHGWGWPYQIFWAWGHPNPREGPP